MKTKDRPNTLNSYSSEAPVSKLKSKTEEEDFFVTGPTEQQIEGIKHELLLAHSSLFFVVD